MNNFCQVIAPNTGEIQGYGESKVSYDILCFKAF